MYIPDFIEFQYGLYQAGLSNWNPAEHEDWELPPLEDFHLYLDLYK